MALIFSGYALVFILLPVDSHLSIQTLPRYASAWALSACWACIVLNFYRLIISSTGVGDGTSEITLTEALSFIPKFVITLAMAAVVSVPMTIWILKSEIVHIPSVIQVDQINKLNSQVDKVYAEKLLDLYIKKIDTERRIEEASTNQKEFEQHLIDPKADDVKAALEKSKQIEDALKSELTSITFSISELRNTISQSKQLNSNSIINSTTLIGDLKRVLDKHKPLFIFTSILLILSHAFPLFIRMMWNKGAYEFSVDFQEEITTKKYGILRDYRKFKDGYVSKYVVPEQILLSERSKHLNARRQSISKFKDWRQVNANIE